MARKKHRIRTDYLYSVYDVKTYTKMIKSAIKAVRRLRKQIKFDAIAFTGTSGAALAYPLSAALGIPLICIRKEKSHYSSNFEGCTSAESYIIVDDFIQEGSTVRRIHREIAKVSPAEWVGIYLYRPVTTRKSFKYNKQAIPIYTAGSLVVKKSC